VIDNFERGSRARLEALESASALTIHEADIRDCERIVGIFDEFRPDIVVHLAAHHFIPFCETHPAETLEVNLLGTQHVLEASALARVKRLLFVSTGDVYQPAEEPHRETDPVEPGGVYGLSKMLGEMLVTHWASTRPALERVVIARLFNVFGPGETNPHLIPEIFAQLSEGDVLRLGNMSPRRDYVWVEDVADAFFSLIAEGADDHDLLTVNVGTGASASAGEVIDVLARLTGRPLVVEPDPARMRASDRPNLQADLEVLRRVRPGLVRTRLEQGLELLLQEGADA
jgi:UDP-glucose 4-epimerase